MSRLFYVWYTRWSFHRTHLVGLYVHFLFITRLCLRWQPIMEHSHIQGAGKQQQNRFSQRNELSMPVCDDSWLAKASHSCHYCAKIIIKLPIQQWRGSRNRAYQLWQDFVCARSCGQRLQNFPVYPGQRGTIQRWWRSLCEVVFSRRQSEHIWFEILLRQISIRNEWLALWGFLRHVVHWF